MSEAMWVALITGIFALGGNFLAGHMSNNKTRALIDYRLNILEKKQDKYNGVIARQYELEKKVSVLENRESVSEHRIEDLEKGA